MRFQEIICVRKSDADRHCSQDHFRVFVAFPVELVHECTEARQDVFWEPDVRLLRVGLTTDFVALLRGESIAGALFSCKILRNGIQ